MIKTIGLGLAVAVLFDAFVVRMALVPAVLALLGDAAWWLPRRLGKALPPTLIAQAPAAHGKSDAEIADRLVVSPLTVRGHIQLAMTKLDVRDRAQLVVIAYQSGLVRARPHQGG